MKDPVRLSKLRQTSQAAFAASSFQAGSFTSLELLNELYIQYRQISGLWECGDEGDDGEEEGEESGVPAGRCHGVCVCVSTDNFTKTPNFK